MLFMCPLNNRNPFSTIRNNASLQFAWYTNKILPCFYDISDDIKKITSLWEIFRNIIYFVSNIFHIIYQMTYFYFSSIVSVHNISLYMHNIYNWCIIIFRMKYGELSDFFINCCCGIDADNYWSKIMS